MSRTPKIPLVNLNGMIQDGGRGVDKISWRTKVGVLERAFEQKTSRDVCILLNSGGGSPTQSSLLHKTIVRLKEKNKKRCIVFCQDVVASGGYFIATAGDEVFVDENSIIGSIGVISQLFNLKSSIEHLGIKYTEYTQGEDKSFLSPFKDTSAKDVERLTNLQAQMHQNFIDVVKTSRGSKLSTEENLFTGKFWLGKDAVRLGLADGINDPISWIHQHHSGKKFQLMGAHRGLADLFSSMSLSISNLPNLSADPLQAKTIH